MKKNNLFIIFSLVFVAFIFSGGMVQAMGTEALDFRFGRMFGTLPHFQPDDSLLINLANAMRDPNAPINDNPLGVPSGFTYLGQFLDHDITLDPTPLDQAN